MNPKMLKKELIKEIEILPLEELKSVAEFVGFIRERQLEESILKSPKIINLVKKSKKDWALKKLGQFIDWEEFKKKFKS